MKEYVDRDWGLETLDDGELLVSGGISWREVWILLEKIAELAEKAEKYWPSFRKGFQVGWEAA
ncbi:MAG: hypothetical protein A2X18_10260 [Bacteroidetes bacterium GWF2_40_14]|nr:MAG: hypothetical protein A2X18_10260 [Bacteroidetes bacterium GWF2_40_14]